MPDKRLKEAIDGSLSSIHMSELQREKMILRITKQEEIADMRKGTKMSTAFIVAAVIMLMSFTVLAAQSKGWVNWKGEFTPADPIIETTPTPMPTAEDSDVLKIAMALIQGNVPAGEQWEVKSGEHTWSRVELNTNLASLEDLRTEISGLTLRLPRVPEGYEVKMIQKSYRASEIILEEKPYWEDVIDGVTLSKYRIKEVPSKAWKGYEVEMINKEGQRIFYSAHIAENDEGSMSIFEPEDAEGYFPIDGDTTATVLKAEDFDRAIRISNEGGYALELQHDGGAADETGQYRYWIESYYIWSNEMFEVEDVLE